MQKRPSPDGEHPLDKSRPFRDAVLSGFRTSCIEDLAARDSQIGVGGFSAEDWAL
jgi:hypothetical protein